MFNSAVACLLLCRLIREDVQRCKWTEREGGSNNMCQSTRGQCKIPSDKSSIRPTCLPPETTAVKPVVGCHSAVAVFSHGAQAWGLITEGEPDHALLTRDGVTGWRDRSAGDSTLILKGEDFPSAWMCFRAMKQTLLASGECDNIRNFTVR